MELTAKHQRLSRSITFLYHVISINDTEEVSSLFAPGHARTVLKLPNIFA